MICDTAPTRGDDFDKSRRYLTLMTAPCGNDWGDTQKHPGLPV